MSYKVSDISNVQLFSKETVLSLNKKQQQAFYKPQLLDKINQLVATELFQGALRELKLNNPSTFNANDQVHLNIRITSNQFII